MKKTLLLLLMTAFLAYGQGYNIVNDLTTTDLSIFSSGSASEDYIPTADGVGGVDWEVNGIAVDVELAYLELYLDVPEIFDGVVSNWYSPTSVSLTGELAHNFEYVDGHIVYAGTLPTKVILNSTVSFEVAFAAVDIELGLAKNSVIDLKSVQSTQSKAAGASKEITCHKVFDIVNGDTLDFYIRQISESSAKEITVLKGVWIVSPIISDLAGSIPLTELAVQNLTLTGSATYPELDDRAPLNAELATAGFVRGLLESGAHWYGTTTSYTNGFSELSLDVPTAATATVSLAVGYLAGGMTTSTVTSLQSPVTFEYYMSLDSANPNAYADVHPEIYYTYDDGTTLLGDYETLEERVSGATLTRYTFSIPFNDPVLTNAVRIVGRLKCTAFGTATELNVGLGGSHASHLAIRGAEVSLPDFDAALALKAGLNTTTNTFSLDGTEQWRLVTLTNGVALEVYSESTTNWVRKTDWTED